jgi:hypothetical protein
MTRDYSYENDKTVLPVKQGEIWGDDCGRLWHITHIDSEGQYPIHGERYGAGKTRECQWMRNGGGYYGFSRLKSPMTKEATALSCASETMEEKGKLTAEEIKRGIINKPMLPNETRFKAIFEENKARWQEARRIIQAGSHEGMMWALCKDGTLWHWEKDHWLLMPPIPLVGEEVS